ncbi:MAG TPA: hypothetical protein PLD27_11105, partial [bacterium]|nr:hypothetical protein [bacterium]
CYVDTYITIIFDTYINLSLYDTLICENYIIDISNNNDISDSIYLYHIGHGLGSGEDITLYKGYKDYVLIDKIGQTHYFYRKIGARTKTISLIKVK